jgi:hypothetical protein
MKHTGSDIITQAGSAIGEKLDDAGEAMLEKSKEIGHAVIEKTKEVSHTVMEKVSHHDAVSTVVPTNDNTQASTKVSQEVMAEGNLLPDSSPTSETQSTTIENHSSPDRHTEHPPT